MQGGFLSASHEFKPNAHVQQRNTFYGAVLSHQLSPSGAHALHSLDARCMPGRSPCERLNTVSVPMPFRTNRGMLPLLP